MWEREIPKKDALRQWNYETHFREYLLLLSRTGKSGLEFFSNFPQVIELNRIWHKTLNEMRKATQDGKERWALVGFRSDMRTLVLPTVFGIGTQGDLGGGIPASVPSDVMQKEIDKAREKTGIVGLVGDIHTHPRTNKGLQTTRGFSVADFYCLLVPERFFPMTAVVEPDVNFFVFKTRESADIPVNSKVFTQKDFEEYWHGATDKPISVRDLNRRIVEKHNLVLYEGKPGSDLEKIYPFRKHIV